VVWALHELWRVVFNVHTGTFFINGWQSWGFTGALHPHQRQPDIATPGSKPPRLPPVGCTQRFPSGFPTHACHTAARSVELTDTQQH